MTMISTSVSAAINHLLAQESWARNELIRHAGKTALFDAGMVSVRLKVAVDGMLQSAGGGDAANVTIRVKLSDLPQIAQNRERAVSYVQIEGDADFANSISRLAQNLRWEAEADIARVIGDIPATRLVAGVKAVAETAKTTHRKIVENVAEYFLDEQPLLVRPQAVADFAREVAKLRDDVERLAKRIEKLEGSR